MQASLSQDTFSTAVEPGPKQPACHASYARWHAQPEWVEAVVGYVVPSDQRPFNYMYQPPPGIPWQNSAFEQVPVEIADARPRGAGLSVDREGFELWDALSRLTDFADSAVVERIYYAEMAGLALAATGGSRAYVFDHLLRQREVGRPTLTFGRRADGSEPAAVGRVHVDYTEASGRRRLGLVLAQAGNAKPAHRHCIVDIWRPLVDPVLDTPLAVCDARSVQAQDLVPADVHYPNRSGEIYLAAHAAVHRWHYFSRMRPHEALVFKQYDSQLSGVARFTPHAAFDHPAMPPDAPLRRSIELRCLVLYD